MAQTWLSQEAYDRLQAEYTELTTEGRTAIAKEIETARALGDLKENAEYHAAKEEQGKMEARIRQLKQLLDEATVGTPPSDAGVVPGLVVTIAIDGDEETFLVGSREDSHDEHEVLSAESPIGQSIMGAVAGDTRTATLPSGVHIEVEVREILEPDHAA